MMRPPASIERLACGGATLIDVLVGIALAVVGVVLIYQVAGTAEVRRRDIKGAGEAEETAALSLARISFDLANAGNGFGASAEIFATCPSAATLHDTMRPISVLINDGGSDDRPDSATIRYGTASGGGVAVPLSAAASAGAPLVVQGADTFAAGDIVAIASRTGACAVSEVLTVSAPSSGQLEITAEDLTGDWPASSVLVNLGSDKRIQTIRYDVVDGALRSTDTFHADVANPLASNVVNLKLQYGIDSDGDGAIDTWVPATDLGTLGSWTADSMLHADLATLNRIKAVRVGVIVRSEFQDRRITKPFRWTLFDCPAIAKSECPGRLTGFFTPARNGGYRYRVHETIVHLRNVIWNS